ncbi:MAG: hypothetical protein QME96_12815 [Myxococcota bacterium]|nr:hypothetical protein [Myxococcota bacterium]
MRKIKEVLRLHWGLGLSMRQSARSLSVASSSVSDLVQRAKAAGLGWPLPEAMDEAELERALYRGHQGRIAARRPPARFVAGTILNDEESRYRNA